MTTDEELLQRYISQGNAAAFEEVVRRHAGMVYGTACRTVGQTDAHDVTQAVFVLLSQKTGVVVRQGHLAGWLHRTTLYCAVNVRKMRTRRKRHEREGGAMQKMEKKTEATELVQDLDEALSRLAKREREAVLLRYLEGRSVAETAAALGVSQEAAGKRAGRGLEKLRAYFAGRGYAIGTAAVVASALEAQATHAVPEAVMAGALAGAKGTIGVGTAPILKGVLKMMWWMKIKLAAIVCVGAIVAAGGGGVWIIRMKSAQAQPPTTVTTVVPATEPISATVPSTATAASTTAVAPLAGPAKTPKESLLAWYDSLLAGDFDTNIKLYNQPTAQQILLIGQFVRMGGAAKELMQATADRFGETNRAALLDPLGMRDLQREKMQGAKEIVSDDTADFFSGMWNIPLVKVDDMWLISTEFLKNVNTDSIAQTQRHIPELIAAIKAGKYKTVDEARQAAQVMMGAKDMIQTKAAPSPLLGSRRAAAAKAIADLSKVYVLADSENLKRFERPFSKQRAVFVDTQYPWARGSVNVSSLGFTWDKGEVASSYMSYEIPKLKEVIGLVLRLEWYNVGHLDQIQWQPVAGDWVIRAGLPIGDRLAALAKILSDDTGTTVKFERKMIHRPCIILKGNLHPAPKDAGHFNVVVVTSEPLKGEELQKTIEGKGPRNKIDKYPQFEFKDTARLLDAPFFDDQSSSRDIAGKFFIGIDAHLDRTTADYEDKLRKVLDNIKAQVGGDWSIEERDIETWEPTVE